MTLLPPIPLKPDDPIVQDMTCTVCLETAFDDPVITTICQHVFCKPCIEQSIRATTSCPNDRHPLSTRQLKPLSGVVRHRWETIDVKCPMKDCTWSGTMDNYRAHTDRCHNNRTIPSGRNNICCLDCSYVVQLEGEIALSLRRVTNSSSSSSSSTTTTTTTTGTSRSIAFTAFDFSNSHYDSFRVVELAVLICLYLKREPDVFHQNRLFHCVENCYNCYNRPDPLADDDEFQHQLRYHKVLQLLLSTCMASTWFTYKQRKSFKFWVRYINANGI